MRVITGSARGRKLRTLEGQDVRPTTDRVKEGIFSIIQFDLPGANVLDLFAGSGQLGIEALSRGAKFCVFVDSSRASHEVEKENLKTVGLFKQSRVVLSEAESFLAGTKEIFDIVLLDPPYNQNLIPPVLEMLQERLAEDAIVLCEHELKEDLPEQVGKLVKHKDYKYGKIKVTVYHVGN